MVANWKSKQALAQEAQGYVAKAIPRVCGNCKHFTSEKVDANADYAGHAWVTPYIVDKNMRCAIGGFAIKKMGTCNLHDAAIERSDKGSEQ
jgi:hypothetical protein